MNKGKKETEKEKLQDAETRKSEQGEERKNVCVCVCGGGGKRRVRRKRDFPVKLPSSKQVLLGIAGLFLATIDIKCLMRKTHKDLHKHTHTHTHSHTHTHTHTPWQHSDLHRVTEIAKSATLYVLPTPIANSQAS